jgi:cyclic pyranopterin phosphate synthase
MNDDSAVELAAFARDEGHVLRFIEYMDVGTTNGWRHDEDVPAAELVERINMVFPIEPAGSQRRGEVARRWQYLDGSGEIGFIASVSAPFCSDCTRARITSTGELFTCLFAAHGTDLRSLLRGGHDDDEIRAAIRAVWVNREDRYSELRTLATPALRDRAEMSYLGG